MTIKPKTNLEKFICFETDGKLSGALSSNRFDFQQSWSLEKLLEIHPHVEDYLALFDYHEDLVIFNTSNSEPSSAQFYQIKTKGNGNWSLKLKKKDPGKGKLTGVSINFLDFLEKLFLNSKNFDFLKIRLFFVSNSRFDLELIDKDIKSTEQSTISLNEIKQSVIKTIGKKVYEDHKLAIDELKDITDLISTQMPLVESKREEYLQGKLVTFLEEQFPEGNYRVRPIFMTLKREIMRKTNYESPCKDELEFKKKKTISKEEFTNYFSGGINLLGGNEIWSTAVACLTQERFETSEIQKLRLKFREVCIMSILGGPTLKECSEIIQLALRTKAKNLKTFKEIFPCLLQIVSKNNFFMTEAYNDEDFVKAMIIYEYFKNR